MGQQRSGGNYPAIYDRKRCARTPEGGEARKAVALIQKTEAAVKDRLTKEIMLTGIAVRKT